MACDFFAKYTVNPRQILKDLSGTCKAYSIGLPDVRKIPDVSHISPFPQSRDSENFEKGKCSIL